MKKVIIIMVTLFTALTGVNAMSYEQAREEALFLTDKMAYELNLNEEQYEACYEINFDYLIGVTTASDLYSVGWHRRNMDLEFMLLDWQYTAYCAAAYFYRPVAWVNGLWHFGIYTHYPHRTHFYFARPACYVSYRGGHCWRDGRSWYAYNRTSFRERRLPAFRGMRDSWRDGGSRGVMIGRGTHATDRHRDNHRVTEGRASDYRRGGTREGNTYGHGTRDNYRRSNDNVNRESSGATRRDNSSVSGNHLRSNTTTSGANDYRGGTSVGRHSSTRTTVGGGSSSAPSGSSSRGGATRGGSGSHVSGSHGGGFSGGHGGGGFGARR